MTTPSAAARVFAIPELLEHIILQVMRSPDYPCARYADPLLERDRQNYIMDSFALKRVSRDFNQVIIGSSKIRDEILTQRFPGLVSPIKTPLDRIWWLDVVGGLIGSINTKYNEVEIHGSDCDNRRRDAISVHGEASWRQVTCLPKGVASHEILLVESEFCSSGALRSKQVQINEHYTLGELYEEMIAIGGK
ncbi:uncharacterized protein MYCFIDRAFT_82417 [Pseudocercospora fijiensis CIRAD86]|uniref:Uncharacterized protein n=1 Tax=Pseudocercospora fijiensis (strain CIRAD86) TaxID=383855 RepID=M3AZA8_PSEFD|nr:uncharacterized protein MYCFIDRAFT_82417 [Pseudocercospora fijiensis CIRAD86]EME82513.1 hypothetical protein MYCFIDRAFT_82417 [Pseudocercospora fijiensis CIRAD86]